MLSATGPAGGINTSQLGDTKECNICRDEFSDWWNLMNHRRDTHPERRRMCRNDLKGICSYESSECWWKHRVEAPLTSTNKIRMKNAQFVKKCL